MKKSNLVRTILLASGLLLQLSTLCFHSRGAAGDVDLSFDGGTNVSSVASLVVQPDGKVLVGGLFTFINGTNRYASARLNADGSLDGTFISDPIGFGGIHYDDCGPQVECYRITVATAAALQPDGKLIVGVQSQYWQCDFEGCYVVMGYFLTRLNANGSSDASFTNTSSPGPVSSIAVQSDGKIVIAGGFYLSIARLNANGSLDNSFNPGTGPNGGVRSIVLQPDGKMLIGGYFSAVNGTNRNGLARLNANGSLDNTFDPGTGADVGVHCIAVQPDGKVLIGGDFTFVNGTNRNRIARLNANGSLDLSFNPGTGADAYVSSIALQSDGKVLIGGDFTTVNGVVRPYVARLYGDSVAPSLCIARSNAFVIVSWPATALNFQLRETTNLALTNAWSPVAQPAVTNGVKISAIVPAGAGPKFFRLKSQ